MGSVISYKGAAPGEPIRLKVATDRLDYELTLSLSAGRIDPFAGERLLSSRSTHSSARASGPVQPRRISSMCKRTKPYRSTCANPEKLSLSRYLDPPYVEGSARTRIDPLSRPTLPFSIT